MSDLEPKCAEQGCDNDADDGEFCEDHIPCTCTMKCSSCDNCRASGVMKPDGVSYQTACTCNCSLCCIESECLCDGPRYGCPKCWREDALGPMCTYHIEEECKTIV